jgi:hypothetical protein
MVLCRTGRRSLTLAPQRGRWQRALNEDFPASRVLRMRFHPTSTPWLVPLTSALRDETLLEPGQAGVSQLVAGRMRQPGAAPGPGQDLVEPLRRQRVAAVRAHEHHEHPVGLGIRGSLGLQAATAVKNRDETGTLSKLPRIGCSRQTVGLVVPTGYAFNLDGTSIYMSICALFVANVYGIPMGLPEQLGLLLIMLLTSKGAATVSGGSFVVFASTVAATGYLPVEGVAVIFGVYRLMGTANALCNSLGNGVATFVLSKWSKTMDVAKVNRALADPNAFLAESEVAAEVEDVSEPLDATPVAAEPAGRGVPKIDGDRQTVLPVPSPSDPATPEGSVGEPGEQPASADFGR